MSLPLHTKCQKTPKILTNMTMYRYVENMGLCAQEGSPIKRSHRNQRGSRKSRLRHGPAPVVFRNPNLSPGPGCLWLSMYLVNSAEVRQGDMKAAQRRRMERLASQQHLSKYLRELRIMPNQDPTD